jgi:hypothetical protein
LVVHKIDRFSRKLWITLEYFKKFGQASVGFASIENQIDYTNPAGKFMLMMQGGLAEPYSDNLSQEVKKGRNERQAQGLYCGLLPFGVAKGDDEVPIPQPETYPGLLVAFEMAANGESDRSIDQTLNDKGCRTGSNQGNRPFSKDTVRGILINRFYLGEIPDGEAGWLDALHEPFIDQFIWDQAQIVRNRRSSHASTPRRKRVTSLTSIAYCRGCGGRTHSLYNNVVPRLGCYNRVICWKCTQKSALLSVYDYQIFGFLQTSEIPQGYQDRVLAGHRQLRSAYQDH